MVQRVGIAQALINDPEVVFLDEPMSGLDPLGRRQIRELILRLRDRGRTVFFSSHVLSDAEALCNRVGILAGGRLVASGLLSDMLAFEVQGWELIVSRLTDATLDQVRRHGHLLRVTPLSAGRYSLELSASASPDRLVSEIVAGGAAIVSLNPLRSTLEDVFVRQVASAPETRGMERV
jgi:ABC-2 type transport system ATP-binding protein